MILNIKEKDKVPDEELGGKAANLRSLMELGVPVPPGIVIPDLEFRKFLSSNAVNVELSGHISKQELKINLQKIKNDIVSGKIAIELLTEIKKNLDELSIIKCAIRSSANVEDAGESSFAGVFKSFLNVKMIEVEHFVKKVWASMFDLHVSDYLINRQLNFRDIKIGVIVQKMLNPEISGVCFTINPVTNNDEEIVIEAVLGLGETLVSGQVTPDTYILSKQMFSIKSIYLAIQNVALVNTNLGTELINVPDTIGGKRKLTDIHLRDICSISQKISAIRREAIDIEFVLQEDTIYIVQVRPITTLNKKP